MGAMAAHRWVPARGGARARARREVPPARARTGEGAAEDGFATGEDLRALVVEKWGRPHEVRIDRVRVGIPLVNARSFFALEVGWKYLGQLGRDDLDEAEYDSQLRSVASVLKAFDVTLQDVQRLFEAEEDAPGTGGGGDNPGFGCIRMRLDVSADGF